MPFKFNVFLTDKEYYDFNYLVMTRFKTGKRTILFLRILFVVCFLIIAMSSICYSGFNNETVYTIIGNGLFFLFWELLLVPLFRLILKIQMRNLKKSGKMPFSPNSVMEFEEDHFTETTDTNRTEHSYSAIEKISIIKEKYIFIHINQMMAYTIPFYCFDSEKQRGEFLSFLGKKCDKIDFYKK